MRALTVFLLLLLATWPPFALSADEPPSLRRNPFARPPSDELRIARGAVKGPTLALLATMVGSTNVLANVAGRILKPGDEIEGYELIEVYEEYAVFVRDGRSVTVYVNPDREKEDE